MIAFVVIRETVNKYTMNQHWLETILFSDAIGYFNYYIFTRGSV